MSTATITISDKNSENIIPFEKGCKDWNYIPAIDRTRPAMIEAKLLIKPGTKVVVEIEFERAYLKYTEFPYDPNRGLDIS